MNPSKPTDIDGLKRQLVIDALNELSKFCEDSDNIDMDELTKRNEQRIRYLRSIK